MRQIAVILILLVCSFACQEKKTAGEDAEFHFNLGKEYSRLFQYDKALESYEKAVAIDPKRVDALNNIAFIHFTKGDIKKTLEISNRGIREGNADSRTYLYQGMCLYQAGREDEGIKAWEKSLELDPGSFQTLNNLGSAYKAKKNYSKAVEYYRKAFKINPNAPMVQVNLADTYREMKEYGKAKKILDAMLKRNPSDFLTLYTYGKQYKDLEELDKAVEMFTKGRKVDPSFSPLYNDLISVYLDKDDMKEAQRLCEEGIGQDLISSGTLLEIAKLFTSNSRGKAFGRKLLERLVSMDNKEAEEARKLIAGL